MIEFNQLYGGDQGVYGKATHEGVSEAKYAITYMVGEEIFDVDYVVDNSVPYGDFLKFEGDDADKYNWVDINGNQYTNGGDNKIPAGNTDVIILYRNTISVNMIRFVDKDGYVIHEQPFTAGKYKGDKNKDEECKAFYDEEINEPAVPQVDGYIGTWPVYWTWLRDATGDVTIHPVYSVDPNFKQEGVLDADFDILQLFEMLSKGQSLTMYQDLSGTISKANQVTFGTIVDPNNKNPISQNARLDLDSYELKYTNTSNGNKDWTLFKIKEGSSLTIGGGLTQSGTLVFVFDDLNTNAVPCLFNLEYDASTDAESVLVLERGVTIEMKFKKTLKMNIENAFDMLIKGHSHAEGEEADYHPGLSIVKDTSDAEYDVIRITVSSNTTLVGNSNQ